MVAGFSVLSLALDAQTDIVTTQRMVSDIEIKKQQERFGIAVSTDANNLLNISVSNLGQNPVGIESFWIINKTLAMEPATRYEINYDDSFVTGGSPTQILTSQPLYMNPDTYDIKVVSSLGTIETAELDVGPGGSSSNALRSVLVTDPPDVIMGQNVTIGMIVTNIGQLKINDVTPSTPSVVSPGGSFLGSSPNLSSVDLIPGESFLFLWDYTIDGTVDTDVDISNFATGMDVNNNLVQSNIASDTSILREDSEGEGGEGGEGEEIIIRDELYGKPELFLTFPSPIGIDDNSNRPLWGVNIANPTDQDIYVSRVVITAVGTASSSGSASFREDCDGAGAPYSPQGLSPTNNWSCPAGNQLQWENVGNPIKIEPRSVFPFLVLIGADNISTPSNYAHNLPITASVFSTLGQFGKSGYMTTMSGEDVAMPNVFLSSDITPSIPNDIMTEIRGITEGDTVTFNAALADMETGSHRINSGSKLIINVPKDWTFGSVTSSDGFNSPTVNNYPDGSTQIVGVLSGHLSSGAKVIQFTATAPDVTSAKMYVMHILADGTARGSLSNNFSIGPISETILQVCDTSGCPTYP